MPPKLLAHPELELDYGLRAAHVGFLSDHRAAQRHAMDLALRTLQTLGPEIGVIQTSSPSAAKALWGTRARCSMRRPSRPRRLREREQDGMHEDSYSKSSRRAKIALPNPRRSPNARRPARGFA